MTRRFTTADLENLMEGTTPAPWRIDSSDPDWPQLVGPLVWEGRLITQEILTDLDELSDPNLRLAAAAPELAAELHRIRTELEAWRERKQSILNDPRPWDGTERLAAHTMNQITLILGDNHE